MSESIEEFEYLAVLDKLGIVKPKKVIISASVYEDFVKILKKNGITISTAVNIGLEMFLRERGLLK